MHDHRRYEPGVMNALAGNPVLDDHPLPFLMKGQLGENAKELLQTIDLDFCALNRQSKAIGG
jgi:hypothetical protein